MPHGHVRGLSQFYADGLERMEIWIGKRHAAPLPYQDNMRIPITLTIRHEQYEAGLRTTPKMSIVWISPDLRDEKGSKLSLASVLTNNGFSKNEKVYLEVDGHAINLSRF